MVSASLGDFFRVGWLDWGDNYSVEWLEARSGEVYIVQVGESAESVFKTLLKLLVMPQLHVFNDSEELAKDRTGLVSEAFQPIVI
jgi:hypothetical protein